MVHIGIISPNAAGHLDPMTALADALRTRGHGVTFFLLGDPPASLGATGFEAVDLGGEVFPADEYRAGLERLGALTGRAALRHTMAMLARATGAVLDVGPARVRASGVTALVVDQSSFAGGTVADRLGLPFATVCNALLLNAEPDVPPFFTAWRPRDSGWGRLRNRMGWAALDRLYAPILARIRAHRGRHGLALPAGIADTWSTTVQISQQPEAFDFPRRALPEPVRLVGPLRLPLGRPRVPFPWERLDGRPLVYASLGTLQNRNAGAFRAIAQACAGLDVQLVMSTGRGVDPRDLGDLPGGPLVVAYAPQRELMARAVLAITHAGLNTVLDAFADGVPMVTVPVTNEQPGVAARVAWTGAGELLPLGRVTVRRLRSLVIRVLRDGAYRDAAQRVRRSIRAGGGAPRAAAIIEENLGVGAEPVRR